MDINLQLKIEFHLVMDMKTCKFVFSEAYFMCWYLNIVNTKYTVSVYKITRCIGNWTGEDNAFLRFCTARYLYLFIIDLVQHFHMFSQLNLEYEKYSYCALDMRLMFYCYMIEFFQPQTFRIMISISIYVKLMNMIWH